MIDRVRRESKIYLRDLLSGGIASRLLPRGLRARAWKWMGHDVHPTALIGWGCYRGRTRGLHLGAGTFLNHGVFFDLAADTIIGRNCDIGFAAMFITSSHELDGRERRAGKSAPAPISVGDGVWIGARVTLLPGTKVGDGCVIAAGAVVRGNCEPHGPHAGIPATRRKELS